MIWLLLIGAVGLTVVVTMGVITAPLRRLWPALLECAQCTGVWVGAAAGVAYCLVGDRAAHPLLTVPAFAFATSILAYLPAVWLHIHNPPKQSAEQILKRHE